MQGERVQIAAESMGAAVLQEEQQLLQRGAEYAVLGRPYIVMEKGQSLADCGQQHSQGDPVQMLLVRPSPTASTAAATLCAARHPRPPGSRCAAMLQRTG